MKNYLMFAVCSAAICAGQAAEVRKVAGPGGKVLYTNAAAQPRRAALDVLPAEVISAVSNVLAISHLVARSRDFCAASFPSEQKKFALSAHQWQQRNATVLVRKVRVMAPDSQVLVASALDGDAVRKVDGMLGPVTKGSSAERRKWCEQAFGDVDRGRLDLVGRASIAPLMHLAP